MKRRRLVLMALLAPSLTVLAGACAVGTSTPAAKTAAVETPTSERATSSESRMPSPTQPSITTTVPAGRPSPLPSDGLVDVVPVITFAGVRGTVVEVDGYVPDILETGGACSATLVTSGATVTASAPAEADATTVWCSAVTLSKPGSNASGWTVTLRYSSATHSGVSAAVPVAAS